jgi:V/A-type H+-transporting ATPase subunit K
MLNAIGLLAAGLVLGLGGIGSCLGIAAAGQAAAGAWASEGKAGKNLSFQYVLMIAAPISQTLYAMIIMNAINSNFEEVFKAGKMSASFGMLMLGVAVGGGLMELFSAWNQGLIGAAGVRCMNENGGKGFGHIIIALGIVEAVGIFAVVFCSTLLGSAKTLMLTAQIAGEAAGS